MEKDNYLKPTNQKVKPIKIYGFDIETYGKYNKFIMGSIVNETEKYIFWNKQEMQNFILNSSKLRNSTLYASNLGFDFLGLFGNDFNLLSKFEYIIRGSDFINIRYKNKSKNHNINFGDTFNFLKLSVENLGKILNIPKGKKPKFLGKKPKNEKEKKELEIYNIRDSYISFKFMEFLQKGFNEIGTNLKYTIASTSMNLFKNKYLNCWIKQPEKNIIKTLYNAYYGGRTEAFYRGEFENKYLYDINSLYPYVMQKYKYPNPNYLKTFKGNDINLIKKYDGVSYVYLYCPKMDYPLLPYRREDKLIFPVGYFSGWYSHAELRKALSLGYSILNMYESIYYTQNINLFSKFVNDLYSKRIKYKQEKNKMEILYKIALNSLYGKFAQKIEHSELFFVKNQKDKDIVNSFINKNIELNNKGLDIRYLIDTPDKRIIKKNGLYYEEPRIYYITDLEKENYAKFINPILSLYITSYARIELYNYFQNILKNNGKIYYCDTDSILTDIELETSNKLGDLKLEYDINKCIIIKPKFYYTQTKDNKEYFKIKGLSGVKDYNSFKKILETKQYEYIKFSKFKESLRRNFKFNEKFNTLKYIDFSDNKRNWKEKEFNIKNNEFSKPLFIPKLI